MNSMDVAVFIGRFQPLHYVHHLIISDALKRFDKLIVVVGSSFAPRSAKNPFTFDERKDMITQSLGYSEKLSVIPMVDYLNSDERWKEEVKQKVLSVPMGEDVNITLIGHKKDNSSFYLDMFPEWSYLSAEEMRNNLWKLDSTSIRNRYFHKEDSFVPALAVVPEVHAFLESFRRHNRDVFNELCEETEYLNKYREVYANLPYPPVFVTADLVLLRQDPVSGYYEVCMIERKGFPGKGTLAIPGGFFDAASDVSPMAAAVREAKEEINLEVNLDNVPFKVFSGIGRDLRGRMITHVFCYFATEKECENLSAGDDASSIHWIPLKNLEGMRRVIFADHLEIIQSVAEQYYVS